jgi:heparan-alpha-glucosaminide N-acetyltransferase
MLPTSKRLLSIDVFRAINMFFMIFVNDLSGVSHVPKWIDHVKGYEDGMHFADTIFPIFLFIAGLSIPLAIGRRLTKGDSFISIAGYILLRSFALIAMGFFHVNMEEYSSAAILPVGVWEFLLTLSFFLIWLDYPETMAKAKKYTFMGIGVAILIVLAILYKGGSPKAPQGLNPSWWGILGIIGWSYLVCAGLYLIVKGNFTALIISLVLLVAINIGVHGKFFDYKIWVIKDGASASLMMFGVVISLLYSKIISKGSYKMVWVVFTLIGILLIMLGFFVRPYTQGISKIHSTPAWVFLCTGIGVLVFELLIWLVDVEGKQDWFKIIKPAGTSTLTCYLIPYFMVAVFYMTHFHYPDFFNYGTGGIIRSFAVSFIVILITGLLEKRRLRLKI